MFFYPYKCFRTFAVWKLFSIYPYTKIGSLYPTPNSCVSSIRCHAISRWKRFLRSAFFKWVEPRILCKTHNGSYLIKRRKSPKQEALLTIRRIQAATVTLGFLAQCSSYSTRITKIRNANSIEVDFQGVPFSTFISADNYYQGYLHTKKGVLLNELDTLLYPKVKQLHLTAFSQHFPLVHVTEILFCPVLAMVNKINCLW